MADSKRRPRVFLSYAHEDSSIVHRFADELSLHDVDVWLDVRQLTAGEPLMETIRQALLSSDALVAFVSMASMARRVVDEEVRFATQADLQLIPIRLDDTPPPPVLHAYQHLDLREIDIVRAARWVAEAVRVAPHRATLPRGEAGAAAADLAAYIARDVPGGSGDRQRGGAADKVAVFVVHGHDEELLDQVERFLADVGIEAVVLQRVGGPEQTLFAQLMRVGREARFAVVLLSPDDLGVARRTYDHPGVGERALQFRARQNVILELGFFYGYLGFDAVVVLTKPANVPFPHFERPSDLDGVRFTEIDASGRWRRTLGDRLRQAGLDVSDT